MGVRRRAKTRARGKLIRKKKEKDREGIDFEMESVELCKSKSSLKM